MDNNIKDRASLARQYFFQGYNCAQSVALAFKDLVSVDESTLLKLASPFGGGMGRLRETCGAVSGLMLILGLLEGYDDNLSLEDKNRLYQKVQKLGLKFEQLNGSLMCRELLKLDVKHSEYLSKQRDEKFYQERPCANLIYSAAHILEKYLQEKDNSKLTYIPQADKDMLKLDKYEEEMLDKN